MPSLGKITFDGMSGRAYRFTVYPLRTKIRKIAGLYIIANRSDSADGNRHQVVFISHTEDLSQPFERHHKAREFERHGANCICLRKDESEESRIQIVQDLVAAMQPVCND